MKMFPIVWIFLIIPMILPSTCFALNIVEATCENQHSPLGVEARNPLLSWNLVSSKHSVIQKAYRILVSDCIDDLKNGKGNFWDSGKITSNQSINVSYQGLGLNAARKYYWMVKVWDNLGNQSAWSEINAFQMGLLNASDWNNAYWIALQEMPDSERIVPGYQLAGTVLKPMESGEPKMPQFRKVFLLNKKIKSGTAFICGLGQFELRLNGKKMGDHFLDPGWTNYDKTALYVPLDITDHLKKGENVLAVRLGNGFLHIPRDSSRYVKLLTTFSFPKMICKVIIEFEDGSIQEVNSDTDWKVTESPITFSSIYGGEDFDATKEQANWDKPGLMDSGWKKPLLIRYGGNLHSQTSPPLKVQQLFQPVQISQTKPGVFIYDFGQNASAIPFIQVKGPKGFKVIIRPGEYLTDEGLVNQNNSGLHYWFSYTLSGSGIERWQPSFTYYGFRYLQVEGAVPSSFPNPRSLPEIITLQSLHVSNSSEAVGSFSCSDTLYNAIYSLIKWSIKSNMASVLTDCPHREKLGWLEVSHLMSSSIAYCYDIKQMYLKVIDDMKDAQLENGLIPSAAPEFAHFPSDFSDSPEWGSAGIILPWKLYEWYGDRSVLSSGYTMMKKYIQYLIARSDKNLLYHGLGDWYDLGPNPPGWSQLTSRGLTPTAFFYYDLTIMAQTAQLLGFQNDEVFFRDLATEVKLAFNQKFFHPEKGYYDTGSQTANAIPLYMGLAEPKYKTQILQQILSDLESRGYSITSGDIGFHYLLRVLDREQATEVIHKMNSQCEKPGYGYQIKQGATSLTESWSALKTSSHNHCMLGHLMEWFYSGIGGIQPREDALAFQEFNINPTLPESMNFAITSFKSPYGYIKVKVKQDGVQSRTELSIPANTSARVFVPMKEGYTLFVNQSDIKRSSDWKYIENQKDKQVYKVGSGKYVITFKKDVESLKTKHPIR